jgi:hypothetical protein
MSSEHSVLRTVCLNAFLLLRWSDPIDGTSSTNKKADIWTSNERILEALCSESDFKSAFEPHRGLTRPIAVRAAPFSKICQN